MCKRLFANAIINVWGYEGGLKGLFALDETASISDRNLFRLINMISQLFTFAIPGLLVGWFFYRPRAAARLGLTPLPAIGRVLMGSLMLIAIFPIAEWSYEINQQFDLPQWALDMEQEAEGILAVILTMNTPGELILNILLVAVTPAIGEELVFRGLLQPQMEKSSNGHVAVWFTAILFSLMHMQLVGFLPRMILGVGLGYLMLWTRNLWVPIVAHFVINGSQVLLSYWFYPDAAEVTEVESMPWYLILAGALILGVCINYFFQNQDVQESV